MKRRTFKSIIITLAAIFLIPLAVGVAAKEIGFLLSSSSISGSMVFYNVKDEHSSLYVRKEVKNANEEYPAPEDDTFTFILKLNGSVVRDQQYTLYDAEGRRLYSYWDSETSSTVLTTQERPNEFEVALKTDRNGGFTLQGGQMAKFEELAPGTSYEIEELVYEPYTQIEPVEGASAVGTLTPEGKMVLFRNLYPEGKKGTIEVRKNVSYPKNYQMPETPDFNFHIQVEGKDLAEKAFDVMNLETETKISEGTTDSTGRFTLKGNTYAVFADIPEDVDYMVEEELSEEAKAQGWRCITQEVQEGATKASGTIVSYTNVMASFVVSKQMYQGAVTDQVFSFQITDGESRPYGKALSYYLYDNNLQLVDEELHSTAEDGTFQLKAGQRAVFVGIPADTIYGAREIESGEFVQIVPTSRNGYENKIVSDAVEELPFVNRVPDTPPGKATLLVTKAVNINTEAGRVPDVEFTFRISKAVTGEDGEVTYEPVSKAAYDISDYSGTRTYSADSDGKFTLRAMETAQFIELQPGETYQVEELASEIPTGFKVAGEGVAEVKLVEGSTKVTITNDFKDKENPYVVIHKVSDEKDADDKNLAVTGAVLQLIRKDADGKEISVHNWVSSDAAGEKFQVKPGTYIIRETQVPDGFEPAPDLEITVEEPAEGEEESVQEFTMTDVRNPDVKIVKQTDEEKPLAGATLQLFRVNGDGTETVIEVDKDGTVVRRNESGQVVVGDEATAAQSWVTTEEPFVISRLDPGTYRLHEAEAPAGYAKDADQTITVKSRKELDDPEAEQTFTMTDERYPDIEIVKETEKEKPLAGARLQLYTRGIDGTEIVLQTDKEGNIVRDGSGNDSWVTTEEPFVIKGILPGTYYIRELEAPEGYMKAADVEITVLARKELKDPETVQSFTMTDERYPDVEIVKETDKGKPLAGAELQLLTKDADGKETILQTDEEGNIVRDGKGNESWITTEDPFEIKGLQPGTYYIRELEAPEGYFKADDLEITVKSSKETDKVQTFTMEDERDTSQDLPERGGSGTRGIYAAGVIIIGLAAALMIRRRRRGNL